MCQLFYGCVIINSLSHRTGLHQSAQLVSNRGGNFSSGFSDSKALRPFPSSSESDCLEWESLLAIIYFLVLQLEKP